MKKALLIILMIFCVFNTANANYIKVYNKSKVLQVYNEENVLLKQYNVRTGYNTGCKTKEGDKKTPCGEYKIISKRNSKYIKFLEINYPNALDKQNGYTGSAIGIHYFNKELLDKNTQLYGSNGCITVWNKQEIIELYNLVKINTKVYIYNE